MSTFGTRWLARGSRLAYDVEAGVQATRTLSAASLVVLLWIWHARSTGTVSLTAFGLLAAVVAVSLNFGHGFQRLTAFVIPRSAGIAYQMLSGFLVFNTLLFLLTLASPLGMPAHLLILAAASVLLRFLPEARGAIQRGSFEVELPSLLCIVFCGIAATLWVHEQQPVMQFRDRLAVFTVWDDVFIHVREISAFAHAHGLASIPDIKMAGASAPVYHFASYMVPAALNAVTSTSAIDAYCAFQLPFGILLIGLAAFSLISIFWKAWPALIAAAAVVSLPDAYQQGFGIRLLSFHFMTQVNLGIFYGIASISVAWIFMIEGCRRAQHVAVGIAYVFLAVCVTYKAHLFVANAFILLLYPCFLFPGLRRRWRLLAAVSLTAIFVTVVWISQMSPRVPTLRLDGSGIAQYVRILMDGFDAGVIRDTFRALYVEHHYPRLVNAIIVTSLIVISSFGFWTLVAPFVFWRLRRNMPRRILWFPALIVINYLVMAHFLALDERGIGTAEEFVNRPIVWAYFVLVAFAAAGIYVLAFRDTAPRQNAARWGLSILACLALFGVYLESRQLQTYPGWKGYGDYAEFNSAPLCLVRAAQYIRDNGRYDEVMQDSRYDPSFVATALSERQAFAVGATSAGRIGRLRERLDAVARIQSAADGGGLQRFAETNRIAWYLMHPEDSARWDDRFLDRAAYQCDGYRVFRLAR